MPAPPPESEPAIVYTIGRLGSDSDGCEQGVDSEGCGCGDAIDAAKNGSAASRPSI